MNYEKLKKALKDNRTKQGTGSGEKYWNSVIAVVKKHTEPVVIGVPMPNWTYTYDGGARAAYIQVRGDSRRCETIHINDHLNIDVDNDGQIVGIEIL